MTAASTGDLLVAAYFYQESDGRSSDLDLDGNAFTEHFNMSAVDPGPPATRRVYVSSLVYDDSYANDLTLVMPDAGGDTVAYQGLGLFILPAGFSHVASGAGPAFQDGDLVVGIGFASDNTKNAAHTYQPDASIRTHRNTRGNSLVWSYGAGPPTGGPDNLNIDDLGPLYAVQAHAVFRSS